MKFDGIHENQARELRSSLAPCSLLGSRDPTFFLVGAAHGFLGLAALSPETSQIHEIHEILWTSMKFDGIHENQPRQLRSSLAPCACSLPFAPCSLEDSNPQLSCRDMIPCHRPPDLGPPESIKPVLANEREAHFLFLKSTRPIGANRSEWEPIGANRRQEEQ